MSAFWKIAAGILAVLVGFLLLVLLINYLGILPLSRLYPEQFGFLPYKDRQAGLQNLSGAEQKKIVFSCPLDDSPCPKADIITESQVIENFKGLGYKDLLSDTDILAVEGGEYTVKVTPGASSENVNIYITTGQGLQLGYRFKGSTNLKGTGSVAVDQIIGTLNGNSRGGTSFGGNYNLIISVKDLKGREFLKLTSSDDGILIE